MAGRGRVARTASAPFRVALTFDAEHPDRPCTPGGVDRQLEILDRLAVRATYFLQGRWVEAEPATARRVAEAGHLVGSHSHYHARMPFLSGAGLRHDISAAEAAIREATGADPRPWFRCPFGEGAGSRRVRDALAAAGYRHVGWSVNPEDWDVAALDRDLAAAILEGVLRAPEDAIVLMHGWPDETAAALPEIVARLRDVGARLVGVDELAKVGEAPDDGA
jgi:peptidoglycan/xylan/chitin deacetylase (PgdA/CDA1 family)